MVVFIFEYLNFVIATPGMPYTFTDEYRYKMVKKFIDMENTPVRGFTSEWDYDRMKWKWEKD